MPVPVPMAKAPGDWSPAAYRTVAAELTATLDLGPNGAEAIGALVYIHFSVYTAADRLKRRQGRKLHLGPRYFLDMIHHYVALSNEKRGGLEEEQRHLNVGLDKLKETVAAVSDLQKSLAVKRTQLSAKDKEANEKLQSMVAGQKKTEEQKQASIELQSHLERQELEISERREVVMADLADAEPAVQEAQASVSNIKKQQLTEVRSMGNPPAPVKMAMESVCIALGHKVDSWKTVQGIIRRDDFIASVVHFDTDRQMTRSIREKVKKDYLSKPGYDFETINRASKACGPLAKWLIAQVRYSEILDRIGPLREEVDSLEHQAEETKHQALELVEMIKQLEADIDRYKDEYAALISETQAIKMEMERVQKRVDRSIHLLESLGSEKERWEASSRSFESQMSTIVGDALLSAAFLTYAGFFDQGYRELMWAGWKEHVAKVGLKFKPEISPVDYLSTAEDRLQWQQMGLPNDSLAMENVIILLRCRRTALVIDPSGQATAFLLALYKDRKIVQTSFLDSAAFVKSLESALRFGSPLLVNDAEHFDPILNPVLNGEFRKTGGRVLIRLGPAEIDFNANFHLVLTTRTSDQDWSPDVCSRVTFCNFTTTRASLQNQCLDAVLKAERPDTDKKRTDLMKLQGEFRLRLRHLEKSLLNALNESQGNILDDDKVIDTLETLKKEAAEVTTKVEETESIMAEVEEVTNQYVPLARACSSLFFILDQLNLISHFYQFSLRFFLEIFDFILLRNPRLAGITDGAQRLDILRQDLFLHVYKRTSRALAHRDHVMLATLLAQVWAREGEEPDALEGEEYAFLLEGGESVGQSPVELGPEANALIDADLRRKLATFARLPALGTLPAHIRDHAEEWKVFLTSNNPESAVPRFYDEEVAGLREHVLRLLVVKCLRPDRIDQAMIHLVNQVFGSDVLSESAYDLQAVVTEELGPTTPIALCSVPGFDASYRVDSLVKTMNVKCTSIAMGSQEGFALADQAIATGARNGKWVLLKNVHLVPSWLSQLEKKLSGLNPNRDFRLFLTCETNPVIPVNFLRASRILMNEPPPGLKASMLDLLRGLPQSRLQRSPAEATRLFFLLAFFHATVTERLRYTPLGWSKAFEFNDSDAEAALNTIEAWLARVAKGRANVDPASMPWEALRSLIKEAIYGGKIDNVADQLLLDSFVDGIFTPQAYEQTFHLVDDEEEPLLAPDGTRMDQFLAWVQKLPEQQPPRWLALPPTAEHVIATAQGAALLNKLVKMRQLADDDTGEEGGGGGGGGSGSGGASDASTAAAGGATASADSQPAWMRALRQNATEWLAALPEELLRLPADAGSITDPLYRFWAREHQAGAGLLRTVRADLQEVISVCKGEARQTNHNRALLSDLPKGIIPPSWRRYSAPKSMSLSLWVSDFARRLAQLEAVTKQVRSGGSRGGSGSGSGSGGGGAFDDLAVTLGLLFSPGAYLTATRQAVAHRTKVSLDNLELELRVNVSVGAGGSGGSDGSDGSDGDVGGGVEGGFILEGLRLEGAQWTHDRLVLNDGHTVSLEPSALVWSPRALNLNRSAPGATATAGSQGQGQGQGQAKDGAAAKVPLSVYLNGDRSTMLFSTRLPAEEGLTAGRAAQRAVAIRAA